MDELLFHPKVVHFPVALGVLAPFAALGLWLCWWRGWLPRRVWLVAVALQALLAVSTFAAHRTGEAEEDAVEKVVPEEAIHEHEEAADWLLWGSAVALLLMAAPAFVPSPRAALGLALLAALASFVVLAITYRTAQLGGELVYRHGAARAYQEASPAPPSP